MLRFVLPALALAAPAVAADRPLGLVESVDGQQLVLRFDGAHLLPGTMVAIYGPGSVEKHPLTKEVIIEQRKLIAKAQLVGGDDAHPIARVLWPAAPEGLAAGLDVVPLPDEAAPNSPPISADAPKLAPVAAGSTAVIALPISDPDGDAVTYRWSLEGPDGKVGRLDARTTTVPAVGWTAPATPTQAKLNVVARDALGHESSFSAALESAALDDPRKRDLTLFARWGEDAERKLTRLRRDGDGDWLALTDDGRPLRIAPGWLQWPWVPIAEKDAPRAAIAVAPRGRDLLVLDGKEGAVLVFGPDGARKGAIGRCEKPTDLAVAPDGTVFVADQGAGGVQIYEPDGRFRGRVGRAGDGDDDFGALTRIALGPGGELYALDEKRRRIQRFDRFQRRLPSWPITGDPNLQPVDLAVHPRGLLLLMASGIIQIYDAKGLAREAMPPLAESGLCGSDVGRAGALAVDGGGEIMAIYPDTGMIARYSPQGAVTGVRGVGMRETELAAADGAGRTYLLDGDGNVGVHDAEGWRTARLPALGRKIVAIAASPDGQTLAGIDAKRKAVVRVRPSSPKEQPLVFGQPGKNNGQFEEPIALAVDEAGRTYVLDDSTYRVSVFDDKGSFLFAFGSYGKDPAQLKDPKCIAVSPAGDACYVYDDNNEEVKKFALDQKAATGTHVTNAGGKGDALGQLRSVIGLGCDRQGLLYVLDDSRGDLQAWDFRGNSAVAFVGRKWGDYGIRTAVGMAVSPDGQPWLFGKGTLAGARWTDRK